MVKQLISAISVICLLDSCSSLRPFAITDSRQVNSSSASYTSSAAKTAEPEKKELRFLNNISVTSVNPAEQTTIIIEEPVVAKNISAEKTIENKSIEIKTIEIKPEPPVLISSNTGAIENASALQIKYAILLNTEVENAGSLNLYRNIDNWYGTRYCMGGTTKKCIDCSGFVQILFSAVYGFTLPRTARDQYKISKKISRTEMKEGDLVFFNTRGGISHVGFYLQNNKFVHASTNGVKISDLFEPYYLKRFIGVGRVWR